MAGPPLTKKIEKKHVKKIKRPQSNRKDSMKLAGRMEAIGKSLFLLLDQFITEAVAKSIDAQIRERISKEMKKATNSMAKITYRVEVKEPCQPFSSR